MSEILQGDHPLRLVREGFKTQQYSALSISDKQSCPLCRRIFGKLAKPFGQCCKEDHVKRVKKGRKRHVGHKTTYSYNPVEQDEGNYLVRQPPDRNKHNLLENMRFGPLDCSDVKLRIPLESVLEVKWRMDNAPIFLAVMDYKWLFLGWLPLAIHGGGILSFGDITLDADSGLFIGGVMTASRCSALIREMHFICSDTYCG